jgi:hypothetical protein
MLWSLAIIAVGMILVAGALRRKPIGSRSHSLLSPVTQQHLHLFQGGRLSDDAVAEAKATLGPLIAHGQDARAEAALRPGIRYAVQVQALAEIGGDTAADLLHRQLECRVSNDAIEQSWYWIDVAQSLRRLQNAESMPHLLRCPATGDAAPLSHFFAAEAACCPGFVEAMRRPHDALGRSAVRMLHLTLRGLRHGVAPRVIVDAKLGTAVATLWRRRPDRADPRVVRVLVETLRLLQRIEFRTEPADECGIAIMHEARELQRCAAGFADYLSDAPGRLIEDLTAAGADQRADLLNALDDLRADGAAAVLPQIGDWPADHRRLGVRLLRWSTDRDVGHWLFDWADGTVQPARRARRKPRATLPKRSSVPADFPYAAILYALRGHASLESEALLLLAARDWDPTFRTAAVGSLGWWEPLARLDVLQALDRARSDSHADVRRFAEAALARLGERRALQTFRGWLAGESDAAVPDAIRFIADERLFWLWPELDTLADSDELETALAAREALEQMREDLAGGLLVH